MGLVLLRLGLGGAAVAQGAIGMAALSAPGDLRIPAALLLLGGALLILGFLTPLAAGGLAVLHGSAAAGWMWPDGGLGSLLLAIVSTAVLLLGPGAFALDARLFGRREIRIERGSG